jgi:hypothetical protein
MMTKKINKVIAFYDDGTFEEVTTGVHTLQNKENKESINTNPLMPDFRPDYYQIREYTSPTRLPLAVGPNLPAWKVTCGESTASWNFTFHDDSATINKYSITSTGNGNVDLSK